MNREKPGCSAVQVHAIKAHRRFYAKKNKFSLHKKKSSQTQG